MWIEHPPPKIRVRVSKKLKKNLTLDWTCMSKQFKDTFFIVLVINYMLYKARDATVGIYKP